MRLRKEKLISLWGERISGRFHLEWALGFAVTLALLAFLDACWDLLH